MSEGLSLRLELALRCGVCRRTRSAKRAAEAAFLTALIGAGPLAVCPGCGQEAPTGARQTVYAYKQRALRFLRLRRERRAAR